MARVLSLFSPLGVMVSKLSLIPSEADALTCLLTLTRDVPMKRSDFGTAVTEASVNVTFKPTNSHYSFYRLAETRMLHALRPSH